MGLIAAFALSNLKGDLAKLWGWLCHRSFWQLAFGAVAIFALIQHFQVAGEKRHSAKLQAQVIKLSGELHRITTAKNEQQIITKDRIVQVTKTIRVADDKARAVENAPLPGNCKSPKEVLNADI